MDFPDLPSLYLVRLMTSGYTAVAAWAYSNQEIVGSGVAVVLSVVSGYLLWTERRNIKKTAKKMFRIRRGKAMTKGERKNYLRIQFSNAIVHGIDEFVEKGYITETEARWFLRRIAHHPQLVEPYSILPQKYRRLSNEELEMCLKILFNKQPPKIPGAKPGEVDGVHVYAKPSNVVTIKRKFGDGMNRRRV